MYNQTFISTSDSSIRVALRGQLITEHGDDRQARIIEEFGITHGTARIDLAVICGSIHGYELKSDLDTLNRLPGQMEIYNTVLDKVTLVVGKNHLVEAIKLIPDWWGITIAKIINGGQAVSFCSIRDADENPQKDSYAIAHLLWRDEALEILEELNEAKGLRSKSRDILYQRLAKVLDQDTLRAKVREYLCSRVNWRSDSTCMTNGG
jgi:hypothetical protein